MQSQPAHRRGDCLAVHRLIDPMPVVRRQTRNLRQLVDIQRLVEMIVDMVEHATQLRFVTGLLGQIVHERLDESER